MMTIHTRESLYSMFDKWWRFTRVNHLTQCLINDDDSHAWITLLNVW